MHTTYLPAPSALPTHLKRNAVFKAFSSVQYPRTGSSLQSTWTEEEGKKGQKDTELPVYISIKQSQCWTSWTAGPRLPCQPARHNTSERRRTAPAPSGRARRCRRLGRRDQRGYKALWMQPLASRNVDASDGYFKPTLLLEIDEHRLPGMQFLVEVGGGVFHQGRRGGLLNTPG